MYIVENNISGVLVPPMATRWKQLLLFNEGYCFSQYMYIVEIVKGKLDNFFLILPLKALQVFFSIFFLKHF